MMRFKFALGVLALTTLYTTGMGQVTKSGNAYSFKAKYVKGTKTTYVTSINVEGPQTMAMSMSVMTTVVDVQNGVGTVKVKTSGMTMNGKPMNGNSGKEMTVKMNAEGKAVGGDTPNNVASNLPAKPVAVGGTWTADTTVNAAGGPTKVKANYKFLRIESVGGKQVAVIDMNMSGGSAQLTIKGQGVQRILMADGSMFSTNMTMNMSAPQFPKPMTMKMAVTRK